MEQNLHENITAQDIADNTDFSLPWVQAIFKKETGEKLCSYLLRMRIERAKKMLVETDLSITEIAFEVGFNSYTRFAAAFKELEHASPGDLRKIARSKGETPISVSFPAATANKTGRERFRDFFDAHELRPCWRKTAGHWQLEAGEVAGRSDEDLSLTYLDALPENFHIEFDFCFSGNPHFRFYLQDESCTGSYLGFEIGKFLNGLAGFTFQGQDPRWSDQAYITVGEWHHLRVEINDDTARIHLDKTEIMAAKDPFPPEYLARCHFSIASWQSSLKIRNLTIHDHGFLPMIPVVRQADSLYRSGIYDRALHTYFRLLESATTSAGIAELQYKIGMCYLRQGAFIQAQGWLSKIASLPETEFYLRLAKTALLETARQQKNYPAVIDEARSLFLDPECQDAVRACIERTRKELFEGGFFDQAASCIRVLCELEKQGSLQWILARSYLPDLYFCLRQYGEAVRLAEEIIGAANCPDLTLLQTLNGLADTHTHSGDYKASEKVLEKVRAQAKHQYDVARCDIIHGVNLRAQNRFAEAISFLSATLERCPESADVGLFAVLTTTHLYCILGEPKNAIDLITKMQSRFPESTCFYGIDGSDFRYPPLFLQGQYTDAAEVLLLGAKQAGCVYQSANQMVRAGILFELAGDRQRGVSAWSEVTRRFLPDRCCFYGDLARSFIEGSADKLETMPYPATNRAEMFYLAGLLFRKRNQNERAQKYFRLAVADDPTLNWYTCMAEKEVAGRENNDAERRSYESEN